MASKKLNLASALLALFAWLLIGSLVGAGIGYLTFAKTPATFEATAKVQVKRVGTETADVSDQDVIVSDATLLDAASNNRFAKLPEWEYRKLTTEEIAREVSQRLLVSKTANGSHGPVYEIRFRGTTPSSAQQVVTAVTDHAVHRVTPGVTQNEWQEALELLTQARGEVTTRIESLESELRELSGDDRSLEHDDVSVSSDVARWERLKTRQRLLQNERAGIESKIRSIKSQVANDIAPALILRDLGQAPETTPNVAQAIEEESSDDPETTAADERLQRIKEREAAVESVERELEPLEKELARLRERLGENHPTVRGVKEQIAVVRSRLDALPPIDPIKNETESTEKPSIGEPREAEPARVAETPPAQTVKDAAQQVDRLLRALTESKLAVSDELSNVAADLDVLAEALSTHDQARVRIGQIRADLIKQGRYHTEILTRLDILSAVPPQRSIEIEVVQAAGLGRQIAPVLTPYLARGIGIGAISGAILSTLLLLIGLAAQGREVSSE